MNRALLVLTFVMTVFPVLSEGRDFDHLKEIRDLYASGEGLQDQKSIEVANSVIDIAIEYNESLWIGRGELLKAYWLNYGSNPQPVLALQSYLRALTSFQQAGDISLEIYTRTSLAYVFKTYGINGRALDYYSSCEQLLLRQGMTNERAKVLHNIGGIYIDLEDYTLAEKHLYLALENTQDSISLQGVYVDLGFVKKKQGDYLLAERYYSQAIALGPVQNHFNWYITGLSNLGSLKAKLGQHQTAIDYFNQAIDFQETHRDSYNPLSEPYLDRALSYISLNQIELAKSDLFKAIEYYEPGRSFSKGNPFPSLISILEKEGDYKAIYEIQLVKDEKEALAADRYKQLNDGGFKFNLLQVEQEYLASQDFATETDRRLADVFWGIGFLMALLSLAYYVHQAHTRKRQLHKMKQGAAAAYRDAYEFLYGGKDQN